MKKLLILFVICALFGCNYQVKNANTNKQSIEPQQETLTSTKQNNLIKDKEEEFVNKKPDLDLIFAYSSSLIITKELPEDVLDLLNKTSIEIAERPEIILFATKAINTGYTEKEIKSYISKIPTRFIEREDCKKDFDYFKVFQVFTDEKNKPLAALAFGMNKTGHNSYSVVFIPSDFSTKEELLYDNLEIFPKKEECVLYYGTYTYTNKDNIQKTVPKVAILPSKIYENPEYLEWQFNLMKKENERLTVSIK